MKKLISLFLMLLMLFSVLFTTTVAAEAKQSKNDVTQDCAFALALQEELEVPRAVDPKLINCSTTFVSGPADEIMGCSHNYVPDMFNNGKHWLVCTKCGKTITQAHTYDKKYVDRNYHKVYCTRCKYVARKENHAITAVYNGPVQVAVYCRECGYRFK